MAEHPRKVALRNWLNAWDIESIQADARQSARILSFLLALTYDSDDLVSWRAVEAYGLAAAQISISDAEFVRNQLRRLAWLLCDESGGIGWRAPELMGETLLHCHTIFQDYIPILVSLLDMEAQDAVRFRAGYLWAIGRTAPVLREQIQRSIPYIVPQLHDRFPQIRGLAAWSIGRVAPGMAVDQLTQLRDDGATFLFYQQQELNLTSVGELARGALTGQFPAN